MSAARSWECRMAWGPGAWLPGAAGPGWRPVRLTPGVGGEALALLEQPAPCWASPCVLDPAYRLVGAPPGPAVPLLVCSLACLY